MKLTFLNKKCQDLPEIFKASWCSIRNDLEFKCYSVTRMHDLYAYELAHMDKLTK